MSTDNILDQVYTILNQNVNISIVIVCLVIGAILKHGIQKFNNDWIPIVLIVVGIVLAFVIAALDGTLTQDPIRTVIIGIASAAASVGIHQSGKVIYLYSKDNTDKKEE